MRDMKRVNHYLRSDIENRPPRFWLLLALVLVLWLAASVSAVAQDSTPGTSSQPATAPTPEPTPSMAVYVVVPGDTLYSIAERFGSTVEAIVAANNIVDPSLINPGQKLVIPTAQPELVPSQEPEANTRVHPVRRGETLPSLAFRYGTTPWALQAANDLDRLGLLWPGQKLLIPLPTAATSGTPGFPQVSAGPTPIVQGQTVVVQVGAGGALEIDGSLLSQGLRFVPEEEQYWALVGVDALTSPGAYGLTLTITETATGDRLTIYETFTVTRGDFGTYNVAVPADRQGLLDPTLVQQERALVNAVFAGVSEQRLWDGAFRYPLAGDLRTTAPFGQRRSYNGGPVSSYHSGHDFGADVGTPVYAPMTGTVVLAEPLQVRGQVIILDHGWGVFTGFWHLSQIDVQVGQVVSRGEIIGLVGNTGLSTGAHLHWEMQVAGVPVDPLQWTRWEFP